jgi:hypothetical protein
LIPVRELLFLFVKAGFANNKKHRKQTGFALVYVVADSYFRIV